MSLGPIRPRFTFHVPGTVEGLTGRLVDAASSPERRCVSRVLANHVDITVDRAVRHRWSPCVQLELNDAQDGTTIHGIVGPHPATWTLYAFITANVVLATVFALMLGAAQLTLGWSPWALWAAPICLVALGALYAVSQFGRRLAADQTHLLMTLVEEALDVPMDERRAADRAVAT